MLALPGLNLGAQAPEPLNVPTTAATRTQELAANTEYRFEVSFARSLTIKLVTGAAEYFGTELAPATTYSFSGAKGAVFTWHGCRLEVGGEAESEYVAEETQAMSAANAHFALEARRERAHQMRDAGPRVVVVGPENAGKTSLVKTLTAYAVKSGQQPVVVNLDPRQGMLSVPGSFTAAAFSSILDIEEGWGSSPISGPSPTPVKMPLVYHYGLRDADEGTVFRPLVTRMALAVTSRLEEDPASKSAGFIIDTPGAVAQGRAGVYENIEHIISEFSGACDVLDPYFPSLLISHMYIHTVLPTFHPMFQDAPVQLTTPSNHYLRPRLRTPLLRPLPQILLQPPRWHPHRPPRQIRRLRRPHRRIHESPPVRAHPLSCFHPLAKTSH